MLGHGQRGHFGVAERDFPDAAVRNEVDRVDILPPRERLGDLRKAVFRRIKQHHLHVASYASEKLLVTNDAGVDEEDLATLPCRSRFGRADGPVGQVCGFRGVARGLVCSQLVRDAWQNRRLAVYCAGRGDGSLGPVNGGQRPVRGGGGRVRGGLGSIGNLCGLVDDIRRQRAVKDNTLLKREVAGLADQRFARTLSLRRGLLRRCAGDLGIVALAHFTEPGGVNEKNVFCSASWAIAARKISILGDTYLIIRAADPGAQGIIGTNAQNFVMKNRRNRSSVSPITAWAARS